MNIRRKRRLTIEPSTSIFCTNYDLLSKFITEQGKIIPRRITGLSAKQQRRISKVIKQARTIAFFQALLKNEEKKTDEK
uniref:Ribosomal protein S18 n=1 Tax=Gloeochaete wittrockiana TaxID=38269 RepID=A0A3G1IW83_9EUKA|nr:ribosomal protein S18 [Gloeochaete wittrockiana]ASQ40209.1 ribosomal protein S18 [Gloeochaete wittrockiana]